MNKYIFGVVLCFCIVGLIDSADDSSVGTSTEGSSTLSLTTEGSTTAEIPSTVYSANLSLPDSTSSSPSSSSPSTTTSSSTTTTTTTTTLPSTTLLITSTKIPDTPVVTNPYDITTPEEFKELEPVENGSPSLWNFSIAIFSISFAFLISSL